MDGFQYDGLTLKVDLDLCKVNVEIWDTDAENGTFALREITTSITNERTYRLPDHSTYPDGGIFCNNTVQCGTYFHAPMTFGLYAGSGVCI